MVAFSNLPNDKGFLWNWKIENDYKYDDLFTKIIYGFAALLYSTFNKAKFARQWQSNVNPFLTQIENTMVSKMRKQISCFMLF